MLYTDAKLLLVDDDPGILRLLSRWLEKDGYPLRFATDGQDALTAIEQECPDLVITDWEMPRIDGMELCRRIRQMDLPHYVYLIFLSVRTGPDELVAALDLGADDFVAKPVRQGELLARVRAGARLLALERRLSQLASTDPLTGLMTQRTFYESLAKEWQRAERHNLPLSCVMLDLDFFKRVNDTEGHPAGDALLKAVAQTLTDSCRRSDFLCRYGGEEFCVLLPETTGENAAVWAERVRRSIATLTAPAGDRSLQITASLGVAQRHADTPAPSGLVDQADQALLCAKQSGRDRVARYESLTDANDSSSNGGHRRSMRGVTAGDVMSPLVACLEQDQTIGQSVDLFLESHMNSMPVVDAEGHLVGILSEKDVMAALAALEQWNRPLREIMRPNVICFPRQTPIEVVYDFLCRVSIRRIIVTGDDGRPAGTISRGTLLRWFQNLALGGAGAAVAKADQPDNV
jgi:diguanylate cyclase (GGDEF)-like protein